MLAVAVGLLLVCAIVYAVRGGDGLAAWLLGPSALLGVFVLNLPVCAFRLYAVVDAFNKPGPKTSAKPCSERRTVAGAKVVAATCLGAIVLFTAAPHALFCYYAYASYDLVSTVFADSRTSGLSEARELTAEVGQSRVSILFLGTDAGYQRSGVRADTIMVASFALDTGRIALFGIPRDIGSVELSGASCRALGLRVYLSHLGSLYWVGQEHAELAPAGGDPGAVVLRDIASNILGIPVDYYVVMSMEGLIDLVDALGGVTVNLPAELWISMPPLAADDHWHTYTMPAGVQHLNGLQALEVARSRAADNDHARMGRQRCLIAALLDQTGLAEMVLKLPTITRVSKENIVTDMPLDVLRTLISLRSRLKTDEMITVGFTPPRYTDGVNELFLDVLDVPLVQDTVRQVLEDPRSVLAAGEQDPGEASLLSGLDFEVDPSDCWQVE